MLLNNVLVFIDWSLLPYIPLGPELADLFEGVCLGVCRHRHATEPVLIPPKGVVWCACRRAGTIGASRHRRVDQVLVGVGCHGSTKDLVAKCGV